MKMSQFSTNNYISEMVEDRWVCSPCSEAFLQALNPLSNRVTFIAIVPQGHIHGKVVE